MKLRQRRRAPLAIAAVLALSVVVAGVAMIGSSRDEGPRAMPANRAAETDQNFYFVMADRFANGDTSNDDGGLGSDPMVSGFDPTDAGFYQGGDLKGLTDRLDYIQGLGTTAIWLTPSFTNKAVQVEDQSAGYHGYWITDFTHVDPHLGTNDELADLVTAAHDRGMKVYFDIITNHTADVIGYQEGDRTAYVSKDVRPYTDTAGEPLDDRALTDGDAFPTLDAATSFPYVPVLAPGEENAKTPAWLNDVTLYHNRGNSTFTGEDSQYGDFSGLDDLFTENPKVIDGMIAIYETWIKDFGIDGFRIDTMKHVDDGFWQRFGPEVLDFAHKNGKEDFFMFGEVFDTSRALTSHYTTTDDIQAVLDFPFQDAARTYASKGGSAQGLATLFAGDDWYTDADSNAYQLPTFLGNHDMGRIGGFIEADNPDASDAEMLARDQLAHALMYFSRGNPVVYYGDEQGFTGNGGDKAARQPMFATQISDYLAQDLIGTDTTQGQDNYDTAAPLYATIADLASVTATYPALRDGAQQSRYADAGSGIFAFSRIDVADNREYLVAVNNATEARTAQVPTWSPSTTFEPVYGGQGPVTTDDTSTVSITVPPLSAVAYRAADPMPLSDAAPPVAMSAAAPAAEAPDRMSVVATVGVDAYAEVSFWANSGTGWDYIGTDDNAPYSVYQDVSALDPGTTVEYAAVVADNASHTAVSETVTGTVADPTITMTGPEVGATLGAAPVVSAAVSPVRPGTSVTFERRVAGGEWEAIGTDASAPAYTIIDDASGLADGADVLYRAVVTQAGVTVQSTAISARGGASAQPDEVALPGTVNSAMGCGEDWAPWCDQAQMTLDPATSTWSIVIELPAGDYEYKIAIDRAWDLNYGAGGVPNGPNIKLALTAPSTVTFTYDDATHLVEATGAG